MRNPSATEQIIAAIEREKRFKAAVLEPIPNSENVPRYNPIFLAFFIGSCEACLVAGFLIGRWIYGN